MLPSPGQIVAVRSRRYLVEEVAPPPSPGDDSLVRLSCLDDDAQGEALDVLWEREVDARTVTGAAWSRASARGLDAPDLFAAYLHTLRWSCVTSTVNDSTSSEAASVIAKVRVGAGPPEPPPPPPPQAGANAKGTSRDAMKRCRSARSMESLPSRVVPTSTYPAPGLERPPRSYRRAISKRRRSAAALALAKAARLELGSVASAQPRCGAASGCGGAFIRSPT